MYYTIQCKICGLWSVISTSNIHKYSFKCNSCGKSSKSKLINHSRAYEHALDARDECVKNNEINRQRKRTMVQI